MGPSQAEVGTEFLRGCAVPGAHGACPGQTLYHIGSGHAREQGVRASQCNSAPGASANQVTRPRAQARATISGLSVTLYTLSPPLEASSLLSPFSSSHELLRLLKPGTGGTTLFCAFGPHSKRCPPKATCNPSVPSKAAA